MGQISESIFRRRLEDLLNKKRPGFTIPQGADPWGMTIKRDSMPGILLWYAAHRGILTLGLTTSYTMNLVPLGLGPPLSTFEESNSGWMLYRLSVPVLDLNLLPAEQVGTSDLVDAVIGLIAWFNEVRLDKNPASKS